MAEELGEIPHSPLNPNKPWICSQCQKSFPTKRRAGDHFRNVHHLQAVSSQAVSFQSSSVSNVRKRDHNGNHIKDLFECSICNNTYDSEQHRPRSLPCGHGFCTQCLQRFIARGNQSCPVCRVRHGANSAKNLPSFLLEELIHKATTITTAQKNESTSVPENMSVDICPEHPGFSIHIICKTHNIKVCPSCTGIDHKSPSCNLNEKKESQTMSIMQQIQSIKNTEKDLNEFRQNNNDKVNEEKCKKSTLERGVDVLLTKIEALNNEILKKQKQNKPIQKAIQSCQKNIRALEKIRAAATNNQSTSQECNLATNAIMQSQKWEETLRKHHNLNELPKEKYAQVKWDGIYRHSKIISDGGRTIIPSLSKEVTPPSSAILIKEDEIKLTSDTTTVFLDLFAQGRLLGRVYINVFSTRARGKQFAMLALGSRGATLKGATFEPNHGRSIYITNYLTENKSKCSDLLLTMEAARYEYISKGSLYKCGKAGFHINSSDDTKRIGDGIFGHVIAGIHFIESAATSTTKIVIGECGIVLGY